MIHMWQAYNKNRNIFTSNTVSLDTSKSLITSFVWVVVQYGAESWVVLKAEKAKIEAF